MAWFDFLRAAGGAAETLDIPLFPLNTVLFPGGVQPLKVFEQCYLDMVAACLKDDSLFGICLIDQGQEVGAGKLLEASVELLPETDAPLPR